MEAPGAATPREYRVSAKLVAAVRLDTRRGYVIAHGCGLHPSTLSKLLNAIDRVSLGDERVLRLASFVGIAAAEAFDPVGVSEKQAPREGVSAHGVRHSLEDDGGGP